jgi:hypothetical protein
MLEVEAGSRSCRNQLFSASAQRLCPGLRDPEGGGSLTRTVSRSASSVGISPKKTRGLPFDRSARVVVAKCPPIALWQNSKCGRTGLTSASLGSIFVLMVQVETLGVARSLGWKVHMRCSGGYREGTKSVRRCVYRRQLDLGHVGLHPRSELSALASGVSAHVPGLRKSQRNRRVRTADQSRGPQRMTWRIKWEQ